MTFSQLYKLCIEAQTPKSYTDYQTVRELINSLKTHVPYDQGKHGTAFFINDQQVLKVVEDDLAFQQFAIFCHSYRGPNTLFPRVYDHFFLPDQTFCCLTERVIPLIKFADAYHVEELTELLQMNEPIPPQYKALQKSLGLSSKKILDFTSLVLAFGKDDIQVNNMGRRKNGQLVIFDPVKP
jgi:hypothetical protein